MNLFLTLIFKTKKNVSLFEVTKSFALLTAYKPHTKYLIKKNDKAKIFECSISTTELLLTE